MLHDFRDFALRGNLVDMAVGILIGGAFGTIAKALVDHVIMPPVGLLLGGADFSDLFLTLRQGSPAGPYVTLEAATEAGAVTIGYGLVVNSAVQFLIVALVAFLIVRAVNRLQRAADDEAAAVAPSTRECPFCRQPAHVEATRCPHCTSALEATSAA